MAPPGRVRDAGAWWTVATMAAVFPANVHMALNPDDYRQIPRAALYARLPVQALFVAWALAASRRPLQIISIRNSCVIVPRGVPSRHRKYETVLIRFATAGGARPMSRLASPPDPTAAAPPDEGGANPRRWWILGVLCLSLMVISLDNTILNTALPTMQRELDATASQMQWIVDAYMLVFAGLLLTAGSIGDRFGRRRALEAGMLVFGLGSLLAAIAPSAEMVIASRAVMGIGGALIMPTTLSILTNVFPAR